MAKRACRVSSTTMTAASSVACGGCSHRMPAAPRSIAWGMKPWPSCCSPRRATKRPPGFTSRESVNSALNETSGEPLSRRPRVACTTSFTDIATIPLLSLAVSRRDLPLGDQGAGHLFPDRGGDIGAFEEHLRLAGDYEHDELRVIGGHEADKGTDRLGPRIASVFPGGWPPGLARHPGL